MEKRRILYNTIENIFEKIEANGDFPLWELSPMEEKAVTLLIQYRVVAQSTRSNPATIFPGGNFEDMLELGPKRFIAIAEKLGPTMIPQIWKVLNANLLLSGAVGAAIGGAIAGAISWFVSCG